MIQRGERAVGQTLPARLLYIAHLKIILLRQEVMVGSPVLARLGLVSMAMSIQTFVMLSPGHFRPAPNDFFAVLTAFGTLAALACCFVAALPLKRIFGLQTRRGLAAFTFAALAVLSVMGAQRAFTGVTNFVHDTPYNNDGAAMDLYAARQVLSGHNPYLQTNIVTALAAINAPATTTTPLMEGQFRGARSYPTDGAVQQAFMNVLRYDPRTIPPEFESKYNYPSGSFLFILPLVWAGLHDMRILYALAIIAMGLYIASKMPRSLRWLIPFVLIADVPLVMLTSGGQPDPMYGLFLMIGYGEWASPVLSPTMMGLACGTKQLAWFFMPFYLLLIARELGWKVALKRGATVGGIALLLNGAFILQAPAAYVGSISGPMTDPMFPLGVGAIALFVANALPMLPKVAFAISEGIAWFGSSAAFAKARFLVPATAAPLAALPLFFAWRSLANYFYLVPLLVLAFALSQEMRRRRTGPAPSTA